MTSTRFILELRSRLTPEAFNCCTSMLRQEPLVWQSLLTTSLAEEALAGFASQEGVQEILQSWSPASLAILAMGNPLSLAGLAEPDWGALTPPTNEQASTALESWLDDSPGAALTLAQAGLISLALREKYSQDGDWRALTKYLTSQVREASPVVACLSGMSPDLNGLLKALIPIDPELAIHALMCHPATPEERAQVFSEQLIEFPEQVQYQAICTLARRSPETAARVDYNPYVKAHLQAPRLPVIGSTEWQSDPLATPLKEVVELQMTGQILGAGGARSDAIACYQRACQTLQHLQGYFYCLMAEAIESDNPPAVDEEESVAALEAWEQAVLFNPENTLHSAHYAHALIAAGRSAEAQVVLQAAGERSNENSSLPYLYYACQALLADDREREGQADSYRLVEQNLEKALACLPSNPANLSTLLDISRFALGHGHYPAAAAFSEKVLYSQPQQPEALALLSEAQIAISQDSEALINASLAFSLCPDLTHRRLLISALIANQAWEAALAEYRQVVAGSETPAMQDLRNLAVCARQAGQAEVATNTCLVVLDFDPGDGLACEILGDISAAEDDAQQAIARYEQACRLCPEASSPWLSLANYFNLQEQPKRALEVLLQASQAAPESSEIQLALGQAYLAENSYTLALTPLRNAFNLSFATKPYRRFPSESAAAQRAIAFAFGKVLRQLRYLEEARQVYEKICTASIDPQSVEPELSYDYAQTLLELGGNDAVLPWLERAASQPDLISARLDYARELLGRNAGPVDTGLAIGLLESVIETAPQSVVGDPGQPAVNYGEAFALLAEARQRQGELEAALQDFRRAIDSHLVQSPAWNSRLSLGLGKVALALGHHETAIAAFLEASQVKPDDPQIYRLLAEAYAGINLPADSYEAASTAARLDRDNPAMMIWYAEQCLRLSEQPAGRAIPAVDSAHQALDRAVFLAPTRADLLIRLARVQILRGENENAIRSLSKLTEESENELFLTVADLQQAAQLLNSIGLPGLAVGFLEQAIRLAQVDPPLESGSSLAELHHELSQEYVAADDLTAGLSAIDTALQLAAADSQNTQTHTYLRQKASVLIANGDLHAAIIHLEKALALETTAQTEQLSAPVPADLLQFTRLALLNHATGDLANALNYAEKAVSAAGATPLAGSSTWLAAELAHAFLSDARAQELASIKYDNSAFPLENACLQAELAFNSTFQTGLEEQEGAIKAAIALAGIVEDDTRHPRLLALQARLLARQEGISETCQQLFNSALEIVSDVPGSYLSTPIAEWMSSLGDQFFTNQVSQLADAATLRTLAEAALDLGEWQAVKTLTELIQQRNHSAAFAPQAQLLTARWLVQRAETQRMCIFLEVVQHAPGEEALSDGARQDFEDAILRAGERIDLMSIAGIQEISHWRARGRAIFSPGPDSTAALLAFSRENPLAVDDLAALIWTAGLSGDIEEARQWKDRMTNHPLINTSFALSTLSKATEEAQDAAHLALEYFVKPDLNMPDALPLLHALNAIVYSPGKLEPGAVNSTTATRNALASIQTALTFWPEEARWHALAADFSLSLLDKADPAQLEATLFHLQNAARLEPGFPDHHLNLAQFYAEQGDLELALRAAEAATQVEPARIESWLALASLQKSAGLYERAVASTDQALSTSSQSIEGLLLRGELALLTNNPRGALSRAQAILNLSPDMPQAWLIMAQALADLDQPGEAFTALEQAISIDGDSPEAIHLRMSLIHRMKGAQVAIQSIQELGEEWKEDAALQSQLSDYYGELGDWQAALGAARSALFLGGSTLPVEAQSHLHLLIGQQCRQAGQLDQAIFHLNEAIQKSPESIAAYLELGQAYQDRRQINQALEAFQMAAAIAPDDYRPYYQAGLALKESKDYLEAENLLRRAVHLAPNEVGIHRQLAAVVALNLVHNRRVSTGL